VLYLQRDITFITGYAVVVRIIDHLKLTFVVEKPPPHHVFEQGAPTAAEEPAKENLKVPCVTNGMNPFKPLTPFRGHDIFIL